MSKIVRSVVATQGKIKVVTCPVTRAHSNESSLKFGRAAYLLGSPSAIVPAFARKFNLPMSKVNTKAYHAFINTKAYHAFINSFPSEIQAMRAAVSVFPNIGLMVDTYDLQTPLLIKIISNGTLTYKLPTLDEVRKYISQQLSHLPHKLRSVDEQLEYPVAISTKLQKLFEESKKQHIGKIARK